MVNLPIGLAALALAARFVPESRAPRPRRPDPAGQLLVITALAGLTYAIIEGGRDGFGTARIVILLAVALGCSAALVRHELRRAEPLLEMRFFTSAPFAGASVIAVCLLAALGGFLFLNTLYLQDTRGYSALHAGLLTLPMAVLIFLFAPVSGRLVGSRGPRLPLVLAGLAIMAGSLLLLRLGDGTPVPWLLAAYVVFGLGFGLVNAPISNAAVSGMPDSQAGVAASVASASRQAGSALGVAITGSLVAGASSASLASASHAAWAVLAACGLGIAGLGWASTGRRALGTAQRAREILASEAPGTAAADREVDPRGAAIDAP
jgi:Na+/melibiose symporter-like transporter